MRIGSDACWLLLCKVHTRHVCVVGFFAASQPFKSERILRQLQKVLSSASSPSNVNGNRSDGTESQSVLSRSSFHNR